MTETTPAKAASGTFTFDTVACLAAALEDSGIVLGNKHYAIMAKLDPDRTASSFEHQFRKVKARAKELSKDLKADGSGANTPKAKAAGKGADEIGTGKKRGRAAKAVKVEEPNGDAPADEDEEVNGDETPAKKKAKTVGKKTPTKKSPTKKSPVKKEIKVEDAKDEDANGAENSINEANMEASLEDANMGDVNADDGINELFDFENAAA